jgi:hypothetical protein
MDAVQALLRNGTDDSIEDEVNTLFGSLYSSTAYMCVNGCESCYNGICGLLETTTETSLAYSKTNFTAKQIASGNTDPAPFISNSMLYSNDCIRFTSGTLFDGKLCFGLDTSTTPVLGVKQYCMIEYDSFACNSCILDVFSENGCYVANCTNINSSAMIDSCKGTGFVGPFEFLEVLGRENITNSTFAVGNCDVKASIEPPVGASTESPVSAPSEFPTSATTERPFAAPTKSSPNASSMLTTVSGSVSIRLASTSSALEGSYVETYFAACESFYSEHFPANTSVSCAFSTPRLTVGSQNLSRHLRVLESNATLSPIVVATNVTSTFAAGNYTIGNYDQALIDAIELDGEDFILLLRTFGAPLCQNYFATVETVDAFSPSAVASLTTSPIADQSVSSPTIAPVLSGIADITAAP